MPSFLRGLFESKAAPKNAVPRAVSNTRGYTGAVPGSQSWDIDQALIQGYERVIWIYRCVDAISSNSSSIPIIVREYDEDGKVVDDPDLLKLLNRRPNIYETAQQFRYRLASQLLLSRRGAFVEVVRNRAGRPIELHLLPPGATTPIPDPDKYVSGYQVQTVQQGIVELDADQVLWIRAKPHPTDVYAQMTPLVVAGLAADTDFLARLYNRNFLLNDGRPGMLVAVQGQLGIEDAEEIRRRFSGGAGAAGQTTVIEAEGIDVKDMTSSPRDVQWQDAVAGSKEDILLAFGVPESVIGNASGRTFDNADAEFEIFWSVTMLPFLDAIGAGFDILTPGGNEDNLVVAHDYSTVDVLQRQKRARDERKMAEFKAGTLTIDEYLEAVGRTPLKVPGTEVLWLPQGMVPVGKNEEVTKAAAGLMPVGQPPDQGQQAAAQAGAEQGVQQGLAVAQRNFDNQNAARALRLAGKQGDPFDGEVETKVFSIEEELPPHPYEAERNAVEAEIGAHLSAWSRRQQRAIIERLGGTKARKHTRHWDGDPGTKALNAQYIVNPEQWADDLVEDMSDLFRELVEREAMKAARELNKAGVIQKINDDGGGNPRGRSPLDKILGDDRTQVMIEAVESVEEWVRESALRQSQRVADKIAEMDEQGASMAEIKREVEKMVDSRSSWRKGLSIAAATSAMEGARNEVYKRGGKYVQRRWRTMRDERVRPAHRRAHNQRRAANKPFKVGGFPMMYPGDPTAPIHLTANCFPADTEVVGRIDGAYRRLYSGTMIEVTTAEGKNLTGTPNHPVLTDQGWVPLGLLVEGTQVIGYDGNVDPAVGVDVHHKPLAIGEVYDSLAVAGVRVASVGVDFHGEVAEGNVDVVGTDRLLRSDGKTAADEFVRQLLLPSSDPMSGPLLGGGSFGEFGDGALLASHSLVSSSTPSLPLIGSGVSHSGGQSGGAVTRLHSVLDQECADGTTPDTDFLSQGLLRLPGKVRLDVVTRVRRIEGWSGHVYNLSTETGAYASNGIIVHNCRCWVEPYVVGQTVESEPRQGVPKSRTVRRVKPKPKARTTTAAGTERRSA